MENNTPYVVVPPGEEGDAPPLPTHSEDGVDLTLIRWLLRKTPAERLDFLEEYKNSHPDAEEGSLYEWPFSEDER